jgi:hypothetical protein
MRSQGCSEGYAWRCPDLRGPHVHETLIWAGKSKQARRAFDYGLLNGLGSQLFSVWRVPTFLKRRSSTAIIQPRNL